jgi:hypothetical protein
MIDHNVKNLLKPGVLFGLHMFYYLCTELLINNLAVSAVGAENVVALYGAISVAVAGGFLLFPLMRRLFKGGASQRFSLTAMWILNLVAFIVVLSTSNPSLFCVAAVLVTLTAGYIGGFILFSISAGAADKAYYGRMFGISCATAIIVQFGFSKLLATLGDSGFIFQAVILCVAISLCYVLLLFFSGRSPFQTIKSVSVLPIQTNMGKYLWGVFFIIAIIWAMEGVIDGVVTGLHANQSINVSEIPRLLHAAGLVLAGFIFDHKEGRFYAPVTMLFMIVQVIVVFLFTSAEGFNIALGAMYLCGAFGSIYSIVRLRFRRRHRRPPRYGL